MSFPIIFSRVKELKARLGSFLLKQDLNLMGLSNKTNKLRTEDTLKWSASLQNLLSHKGQHTLKHQYRFFVFDPARILEVHIISGILSYKAMLLFSMQMGCALSERSCCLSTVRKTSHSTSPVRTTRTPRRPPSCAPKPRKSTRSLLIPMRQER